MSKARSKLPHRKAPVITMQRAEYRYLFRSLQSIENKAINALQVLVAIDCRAGMEFAESMRIIKGLPEEGRDILVEAALELLCQDPSYIEDARQGAHVDNTIVGSVLSTTHHVPRPEAERAVAAALLLLDEKGGD